MFSQNFKHSATIEGLSNIAIASATQLDYKFSGKQKKFLMFLYSQCLAYFQSTCMIRNVNVTDNPTLILSLFSNMFLDYFYTDENEQLKRNVDFMKEKLKSHEQVSL